MGHQLSLSFELICLLDWLLKHEKESLKKLITQAVDRDLLAKLSETKDHLTMSNRLHQRVIEFVVFLEDELLKELSKGALKSDESMSTLKEKIAEVLPASEAVLAMDIFSDFNDSEVDAKMLTVHLQQVRAAYYKKKKQKEGGDNHDVEQGLLKQLLKHWKPKSNETVK